MSDATHFGEQLGDFLRGLLRTPSAAAQRSPEAVHASKWAVIDANEMVNGTMVSLDLELDPARITSEEEAQKNAQQLRIVAKVFIDDICASYTFIPPSFRRICGIVS